MKFLFFYLLFFLKTSTLLAYDLPVSATIPDLSFNPPVLLTPNINATVNTTRPLFSWSRPSPLPTLSSLSYYDFYLDGAIFATSVSDSLTSLDYYFYTASASSGIFSLSLKTDLAQGYHTWNVTAYTENGVSSSSLSRRFYLDSLPPFISVTKVDKHSLRWSTEEPNSIPPENSRYLTSSIANPTIKGGVERSSNIRITLICPPACISCAESTAGRQNIPNCHGGIFAGNIPTGSWETKFENLLPGIIYQVDIKATDAAGNHTSFPPFYLTYGKMPALLPPPFPGFLIPSTSITPPITEMNIITPTTYIPPAPTPPSEVPIEPFTTRSSVYSFLLYTMVFGLLLHLLMASIGTSTPMSFLIKFLLILGFPFIRKKEFRTVPFTFISIYQPNKLDHAWQSVVSDIRGDYDLRSSLPESMFIETSALGRSRNHLLTTGSVFKNLCLNPLITNSHDGHTRLLRGIYTARIIPLTIALITGSTAMITKPSYCLLVFLYLSFQYLFSEYIYPEI
ncbi:MAG: hypothetical protein UW64_C0009G0034 [Microgenomates group bacterium GW2011_GWC1_44_37]|uniref:Fibronectin type-III domain-containing protein n=1 Tax=Candidatus Collierbacteria bacterium GW2011_GWB2_44_22 TaxID=1618387 RepID=A0A0G1KVF5_9BACT|nr:MAG: hypothetical protein UW31_C0002G0036 [Candidatus Collierbacteria bacterium GW2011_GWA2_44_13]KKT51894.1 MAG: hypothetical protein UW44_C0006G0012 [Candidatus Collierbacteria bacterium GW2011_GWB2_44_22]KKT62204.1 MAG: hypothetical protein UW56_C0010G0036 [Candidatus Collierbacteria bacterium GW2011_GWD1_44_27]KKT66183.1 MAG: hypothetical protein UW58_C0012G0025 [Candidatus Collierbacteria bacterium GW2011_GWC2_44_30]KKT68822.1 MAG: hypothetical protein UW64_C0009G0034 [Microgenomates gr